MFLGIDTIAPVNVEKPYKGCRGFSVVTDRANHSRLKETFKIYISTNATSKIAQRLSKLEKKALSAGTMPA